MTTATLTKPRARRYNPLPDLNFPLSLLGAKESLPYRIYIDDFYPVECPYLIVTRDILEYGWLKAQSLEDHYRELFTLGFDDDDHNDYYED